MQTKFRIREAGAEDVPAILELVKQLADYEKLRHLVSASEEDFRRFGFGEESYYRVLLAEWNGKDGHQAVGFALYFFTFSTFLGRPTLYLEDLFVVPEFRGRGIGKALLKQLAQIALEKECGRMEWAVLDWNEPAIRFYQSIGAKPLRGWVTYRMLREDLLRLVQEKF